MVNGSNILDQLLGGLAPQTQKGTGVSAENGQNGDLFLDLMTMLTGGGDTNQALALPTDQPALIDGQPTNPLLTGLVEDGTVDPETAALIEKMAARVANSVAVENQAQLAAESELPLSVSGRVVKAAKLPTAFNVTTPQLDPAVYQIADSRTVEGRLELTLVDEKSSEPIRISLPADLVKNKLSGAIKAQTLNQAIESRRIPIETPGHSARPTFEKLVSDLNLRSLEIHASEPAATDSSKPVLMTLSAEANGQEVAIRARMARHQIQTPADNANPVETHLKGEEALTARAVGQKQLLDIQAQGQQNRPGFDPTKLGKATFDLADRLALPGNTENSEADLLAAQMRQQASANGPVRDLPSSKIPAVKMTIPDLTNKPFQPDAQTIMIKIHPDHLGPARLSLSLRDQMLTARVTVDTPVAKAAVEGSLDQLTEQLNRAGIQIDRVEVNLSGGGARQQFFDRRPNWSHSGSNRFADGGGDTNQKEIAQVASYGLPPSGQYAGPSGVNLLA